MAVGRGSPRPAREGEMTQQNGRYDLSGLRVALIVADDFEQSEMTEPRKALEQAGAETVLIGLKPGKVQGMQHDQKADTFDVQQTLDQANPDGFDALELPGGALNADTLRMNPKAQQFVRSFQQAGKPMAVICHAPWLLVSAGLVAGRTLTSYHTIQDDIRNAGGNWVDREVVRDHNLVTSRSPKDLPAFNREMIALFAERRGSRAQAQAGAARR
jgi:protease I